MKRMVVMSGLLAVALLSLSVRLPAQAPDGPIPPRPGQAIQQAPPNAQRELKVQVGLVNMPVTVRDRKGEMVHDLEAKDFEITDNGVVQKISHFDLGGDPLSVVILIETSSRIEPILGEMRKTGILFTQTVMGPEGEAAIVGFNDAVDKLQDFSTDSDAIENVVTKLEAGTDGSKLYDAMAVGVQMLSERPQPTAERPGKRRVMLVMSETIDVGSEAKLGEVLRKAQIANVTIYSVGLSTTRAELNGKSKNRQPQSIAPPGIMTLPAPPGTIQTPSGQDIASASGVDLLGAAVWAVQHVNNKVKDHAMEIACVATGGAHLGTFKNRSIEDAIDEIGGELHAQYSVSYAPTDSSAAGYHEIKVEVDRKNLKVRARPGYYIAQE